MAAPSDSNNTDKSRMEAAHFPDPSEVNIDVGELSEVIVLSEGTIDVPVVDWKSAMKMKWPLPPLHHHHKQKSSPAPAKSRVSLTLDKAVEYELEHGRKLDPNIDTKTLRRTVSNRLAAQRSRMRSSQFIIDMEKRMKDIEELIKSLTSQIETYKEKKRLLQEENHSLRTAVEIRANESKIGEDNMEEMKREIMSLKENLTNPNQDDGQCSNPIPEEMMMMMQESEPVELSPKPYSIEFYEQRLMQMEMNHQQQLIPARSESEADSLIGLINFEDDEEGVDQYLNLDEMNLDDHHPDV